uniref:CSN8/PSMD8/EIF3K domain-containing protein n=1 Tax=Mucochytrium quahogii TaxID=96639 RepID=A0A7S2WG96_9STRA
MAENLVNELKKQVDEGNIKDGEGTLGKLKLELMSMATLPPNQIVNAQSKKERLFARQVFELAVLLSVKARDIAKLERHMLMLRSYNFEYRTELGDSPRRDEMIGLELLTLLVDSRLAEFHSLLELVPMKERENIYVTFVVELEQYLMEGSYNKVLAARTRTPSSIYTFLLENLEETVREEIAGCIEVSYPSISIVSMVFSIDRAKA